MTVAIYEKKGRAVRFERFAGMELVHETIEHGVAAERDGTFEVRSGENRFPGDELHQPAIDLTLPKLRALSLQRVVMVAGVTRQRFTRDSSVTEWTERSLRSHCSVRLAPLDIVTQLESAHDVDDPGSWPAELVELDRLLTLPRVEISPGLLALTPRTGSQLLAQLAGSGALEIEQHGAGILDGDGNPVRDAGIVPGAMPPNRARPSYRYPPRSTWMSVALRPRGARAETQWRVPLLLRSGWRDDAFHAEMLAGSDAGWTTLRASGTPAQWADAIQAIGPPAVWYPAAPSGMWGSELRIDIGRLTRR